MSTILKIFASNQNVCVKDIQFFPNWYSMSPRLHFYQGYDKKKLIAFFLSNKLQFLNFHLLMAPYNKKLTWERDVYLKRKPWIAINETSFETWRFFCWWLKTSFSKRGSFSVKGAWHKKWNLGSLQICFKIWQKESSKLMKMV